MATPCHTPMALTPAPHTLFPRVDHPQACLSIDLQVATHRASIVSKTTSKTLLSLKVSFSTRKSRFQTRARNSGRMPSKNLRVRISRGGLPNGLPNVSLGPALPYLFRPCGQATQGWAGPQGDRPMTIIYPLGHPPRHTPPSKYLPTVQTRPQPRRRRRSGMGVWQGVAMDSQKFHPGPLCPTLLRPADGPPLKRP
jgi:hypothetical protein